MQAHTWERQQSTTPTKLPAWDKGQGQGQSHVSDGDFQEGMEVGGCHGMEFPCAAALRAEPVMEAHLSTRHSSGSGILEGSCFALGCLEESCSSTGFNSQPCLQPAASGLAAGVEMLSRKKK